MNRAPQHGIHPRNESEYRRLKGAIERAKEREPRASEFGVVSPEGSYPSGRFPEVKVANCVELEKRERQLNSAEVESSVEDLPL